MQIPGDLPRETVIERIVRVNHAGEYGAKRVYDGQLTMLSSSSIAPVLERMAEQEHQHFASFEQLLSKRSIRPSALLPIWHIVGFALGAYTALLGKRAAMACTVAIEEVIDEHYNRQIKTLDNDDLELLVMIKTFRSDEAEHRSISLQHGAADAVGYSAIRATIKIATKAAIWLSERF
jgi:ubiquinone biosynthesis monooxygenase Coq7